MQILSEQGSDAKLLAGGTDLVIRMRSRVIKPKTVVSLNAIPELSEVTLKEDGLNIGAMARLMDVSKSELLTGAWKVVKNRCRKCIQHAGSKQCHSWRKIPVMLPQVLTPFLVWLFQEQLPISLAKMAKEAFCWKTSLPDLVKTVLADDEMLVSFKLPKYADKTGAVYKKYSIRGDTDIAIIGSCR